MQPDQTTEPPSGSDDEWQRALEARLTAVEEGLVRAVALLEEIDRKVGPVRTLYTLVLRQVHAGEAILRRLYLDPRELPFPERLTAQRFQLSSQNGEDGLVLALL